MTSKSFNEWNGLNWHLLSNKY